MKNWKAREPEIAEAYKAGEQESDKKWRQILKDSVALAELSGKEEVMEWIETHQLIEPAKDSITRFEPFYQIEKAKLKEEVK